MGLSVITVIDGTRVTEIDGMHQSRSAVQGRLLYPPQGFTLGKAPRLMRIGRCLRGRRLIDGVLSLFSDGSYRTGSEPFPVSVSLYSLLSGSWETPSRCPDRADFRPSKMMGSQAQRMMGRIQVLGFARDPEEGPSYTPLSVSLFDV